MTMTPAPSLAQARYRSTALQQAIVSCAHATGLSRELDSAIAKAVFPALAALEELEPGIWRHDDGSRVRALNYTRSQAAAATLVPAGCWIEEDGDEIFVIGPGGAWSASHAVKPIALCLAALRSRTPEDGAPNRYSETPKEIRNGRP